VETGRKEVKNEDHCTSEVPPPFSEAWWDLVTDSWNNSQRTEALAGFGWAGFEVTDRSGLPPVFLYWDEEGRAKRLTRPAPDIPVFSATLAHWTGFVMGEFTALRGVMRRLILFRGPIRKVLPYTQSFNELARVSRPLIE